MVNEKRIVPVTNTDLLTLYGLILKLKGLTIAAVSAGDTGVFAMTSVQETSSLMNLSKVLILAVP